ncbi:MAG: hypothetical protein ACT4PL_09190 [Phycisphaerales bacterium]
MAHVEYHHIGHDPSNGALALWSIDERGRFHESRREFARADAHWLDWSHENAFPDMAAIALGRVELDRRAGSLHISDVAIARDDSRLMRVVTILEKAYPGTRWFLFGPGFRGESLHEYLARLSNAAA